MNKRRDRSPCRGADLATATRTEDTVENVTYDVCFSFATEQRDYVERVAKALRERQVKVFYDQYEQASLWGKNLYEHLDFVYRKASRFCVLFASADYAIKVWTNHERRSAQARALESVELEYLLPARFDDTEVPGLLSSVGYIDLKKCQPERLADLIVEKLTSAPETSTRPQTDFVQVPRTRKEVEDLLNREDEFWEYKLFAGELLVGRSQLQDKVIDHEIGFTGVSKRHPVDNVFGAMKLATEEATAIIANLNRLFSPNAQTMAFGEPGQPGDAVRIKHLAKRILDCFVDFLDWAAHVRGMITPGAYTTLRSVTARMMDQSIGALDKFIDDFVAQVDRIPALLAQASDSDERIHVNLEVVFEVPPELVREFEDECERLLELARTSGVESLSG